jgi:hypothetical protein
MIQKTDKFSNNKTKTTQKQNEETTNFDMKYTYITQGPYKKQ